MAAPGDDPDCPTPFFNCNTGSAYVFTGTDSGWVESAKLTAGDGLVSHRFGSAVALDGDRALVGAEEASIACCAVAGAAFLFELTPSGCWAEAARLEALDGGCFDQLGGAVALGPDWALAGARGDGDAVQDGGSAYAFELATVTPGLAADVHELSVATGGTQTLEVVAGTCFAGDRYYLIGTMSGTEPGFPIAPFHLDLNLDGYFLATINAPLGDGVLSTPAGAATAAVTVIPGSVPGLAGTTFHHAYLVFDLQSGTGATPLVFASGSVPLTLTP